jgi:signal-transduction protein with cAMP-binding, CBS, and nucleotidyltransferase domain
MLNLNSDALDNVRVGDCMRTGFVTCDQHASIRQVAATMSAHRVHAVIVCGAEDGTSTILTDLDLIAALAVSDELTATEVPASDAVTIPCHRSLRMAAQLMAGHGAAHLIVLDDASGHPVGVLSTIDVLDAYALVGVDRSEA